MRMQKCSHCGAENSVKRTACYHCQTPLTSHIVARSGPTERPVAASRWEAIEPVKQVPARNLRPMEEAVASPFGAAPAEEKPPEVRRTAVPLPRNSRHHVRQMAVFYRELHALLKAGITLVAACHELEHRVPREFRALTREMGAAVEAGKPISDVLAQHRDLIYPWHLGVVRAAESAGSLPEALDQIARAYEIEWETRSQIALRVFFYGYLVLPMLVSVIPLIMFMQRPFPKEGWTPASVIAEMKVLFLHTSLPFAEALLAIILLWRIGSATVWFQGVQQRLVLALPLAGRVSRLAASERYLSTLGMLLTAGVPLSESVEEAAMAAGNAALTPRLLEVGPKVRAGAPLAAALREAGVFDADTLRLAGTGEMTGTLPAMLSKAADYVRDTYEMKRRNLMRVGLAGLALLFGAIVFLALYIGFTTYYNFAFRVEQWMQE
jgi:type II secretory pathway component PulF